VKAFAPVINFVMKFFYKIVCRISEDEFKKIPAKGPYVLVGNHICFMDIPLLYLFLQPRYVVGLGKKELLDAPIVGALLKMWNVIGISREEADIQAIKSCLKVLKKGAFLSLAPEGTRSNTGVLQKGKAGTILLAYKSKVPILPLAHWGLESFNENFKSFKRTSVEVKLGRPFVLDAGDVKVTQEIREEMVDQVMYEIAALMPEQYRGVYSDMSKKTGKYLKFVEEAVKPA